MISTPHTFHSCDEERCFPCTGGLGWCTVCGGAEGSLPTDCPKRQMLPEEEELVYGGALDFKGGMWVERPRTAYEILSEGGLRVA